MATLDPRQPETWPLVLTLRDVAAIYQRTPEALRAQLKPSAKHRFLPAPYRARPYQWRRADVLRDVEGARGANGTSSESRTVAATNARLRARYATTATTHASEG